MARLIVAIASALAVAVMAAPAQGPQAPATVQATYFRYEYRCYSCLKLERWAGLVIQEGLKDSIRTGRLKWGTMDMESPQGAALADKIGLMNKNVVLMEMRGGKMTRSKELVNTWKLLRDSAAFASYVKTETIAFLKEAR
ncbi:MAG: hypothetical protein IPN71_20315 [Fibrobacteres bacterium]|nr:hypothetical protein [Fibrobacterota bacterium]